MFVRRFLFLLATVGTLAACSDTSPLLDEGRGEALKVVDVTVDGSGIDGLSGGRNLEISPEQITADVDAVLTSHLMARSAGGSQDVVAEVVLDDVKLITPGQRAVLGGSSSISGVLTVRDAASNEIVLAPTEVVGLAEGNVPLGGFLGAVTTKSPNKDYQATLSGFASNVSTRLLGRE